MEDKDVKVCIDLACGQRKKENFIGIDICKLPEVDIVHDLNIIPWPFESESVNEIFCSHYIEHVKDLIAFMDECYRILAPGGKITFIAPYYTSSRAFQDPTHVRFICDATFLYFNKQWRDENKLEHYAIKSDFDFTIGYAMTPEWAVRSEESRNFAIRHYWNVISDIHATLIKREIKKV